jgi:N-6 DNA Methylase/Eco57I restriction-modification methylase
VLTAKTDQACNFESFRATAQNLSLGFFRNLSGGRIKSVSEHVLFKDILAVTFAGIVRRFAQVQLSNMSKCSVRSKHKDGLNSLSLIRREERINRKLKRLFGAKLTSAMSELNEQTQSSLVTSVPIEYIGMTFETMYGTIPDLVCEGTGKLRGTHARRDKGVFFTPPEVVRFLTRTTLAPALGSAKSATDLLCLKIVDPAQGAGFFLLESLRLLSEKFVELSKHRNQFLARRLIAKNCLYGIDIDDLATDIAKALLWLEVGDMHLSGMDLDKHIKTGDALLAPHSETHETSQEIGGSLYLFDLHDSQVFRHDSKSERPVPATSEQAHRPFSWELNFPQVFLDDQGSRLSNGGFDVVLSNPPWGKIKPEFKEFYSHLDHRVSQYQGPDLRRYVSESREFHAQSVDKLWRQYAEEVRRYAVMLQECGIYQNQRIELNGKITRGDSDLYKYFMERSFQVLKKNGRLGLVVPAAFHRSEGAAGIRRLYWDKGRFETFLEFENRKNIFPIHGMFRFVLLTYQRGGRPGIKSARFGLTSIREAETIQFSKRISISAKFLTRVGGNSLTIPEVRSKLEKRLLNKLYAAYPILGNKSSQHWNVSFVRELDMTKDSGAFFDREQLREQKCLENEDGSWSSKNGVKYLPLYEGRMVNQFDNAAKAYKSGQGRTAQWIPLPFTNKAIVPHYFVPDSYIEKYGLIEVPARAGFCDVTGHANERTVLSALIPPGVACGNKVPTVLFDHNDPKLHLIWLALANSFVIDWLVRRRISTTLNFFHWYNIPFPRINPNSNIGQELSQAAAKLCYLDTRQRTDRSAGSYHKDVLRMRSSVRADIDAIVAELFDLNLTEYVLVLSDFQIIDRYQPTLRMGNTAETRSTITRDKALKAFGERKRVEALSDIRDLVPVQDMSIQDLHQRILMAEAGGAIAYVPSEHACIA